MLIKPTAKTRTGLKLLKMMLIALLFFSMASCATLTGTGTGSGEVNSDAETATASGQQSATAVAQDYPGKYDGSQFFWRLERDGKEIYILGSIHVATEAVYPLSQEVMDAFSRSGILVEEVDLTAVEDRDTQNFVTDNGQLPEGTSIADYLSDADLENLKTILGNYGIPYSVVEHLKPWVISSTLTMLSSFEANMDPSMGIDVYFSGEALDMEKKIYPLETVVQQLDIMNNVSLKAQAFDLSETLAEFDNLENYLVELLGDWVHGDMKAMEDFMLSEYQNSAASLEYYDSLLIQRNRDWKNQLLKLIDKQVDRPIFVVVGTGHLIGPDSLIDLLMNEGFSARRY